MKTPLLVASLLLVLLAPFAVAQPDPVPACSWNRKYVDDVVVSYRGNTVAVLFYDGAYCQVEVKCGGYTWNCWSTPLPPAWLLPLILP